MGKPVVYSFVAAALILFSNKLFAQAPIITYPSSSYIYRVGTAIATLSPSNSGGAVYPAYTTPSSFVNIGNAAVTVTLDASGNVYSADFTGKRILKWNSSGGLTTLNTTTTAGPAGIVVDGFGNIYVGDKINNNVYKFNSAGTLMGTIPGFNTPEGLACDASNNIYVADDAAGNVVKIAAGTLTQGQTWTGFASAPYGITVVGNDIYVSESTPGTIIKIANGVTGSTTQTTFATGFSTPRYLTDDGGGNIYVADLGSNTIKKITPGGVVSTIIGTTGGLTSPRDVAVNSSGVFYIANNSSKDIVTSSPPYNISPMALPAGLNFDPITGNITGTPTAVTAATTYTITGHNASGNSSATITITCYSQLAWNGATSAWALNTNWTPAVVPTSLDPVSIGSTAPFTAAPVITANATAASIVMGTLGGHAAIITVNGAAVSLTVPGDITYQSDASSQSSGFTAALAGNGTISANNINIIANTNLASYTEALTSSVANLNLSGNLNLTTSWTSAANKDNASFSLTGGTMTMTGINTTNANAANVATIATSGSSVLQFTGAAALSGGLSGIGTNTITLGGATIGYTGNNNQTVYTNAAIANSSLTTGISYTNLTFSGTTGIKTPNGNNSNSLNVSGNFTNSLISNATTTYADLSSPTVNFTGSSPQALVGGTGTGTKFYKVLFSGAGAKTMSGIFSVASSGILTISGAVTTLNAGSGVLTLNSDATGSASIAAITSPSAITGNVNVQRYITGNSSLTYRGYRLLSSPVQVAGTGNYNLTYLKGTPYPGTGSGSYLTGAGGTGGGFDAGTNPTIYFYRQDMVPTTVFNAGNYRAVTAISPALTTVDGPASMPVGNGFLYFYRGNNGTVATTVPGNLTFSSTGALNQGKITVNLWFYSAGNPSFAGPNNLSYSTASGKATVEGFNLVGNPYASSIDWNTAYNNVTSTSGIYAPNTDQTIYIYDATTKNYDTYLNTSSSAGSGTNGLTNIIPSGQGFFVHATSGAAQLIFNESAKVNTQVTNGAGLLLNAKLPSAVVDQHLRLQLAKDSVNKDETILIFNNAASTDYVQSEDALYLTGAGILNLSNTSTNNKALAISQIPFPKQSQTQTIIPLNVSAANTGTYKFSLTEALNIPALFDVWLMDAYTRDSLDMKHNPVYNFNVSADTATAGAKRFTLVIRQNKAYAYHLLSFNGLKAAGGAQLSWTTENEADYTDFTLERSTGSSNTFTALNTITATGAGSYGYLDTNPAGINRYRLKQTDINGTVTYSNVVQLQYADLSNSPLISNISLYPNPARDVLNLTILNTANAAASYTITITSSNGNLIKTYTSQQTTWQNNISDLLPGAYIVQVINNAYKTVVGESKFIKI